MDGLVAPEDLVRAAHTDVHEVLQAEHAEDALVLAHTEDLGHSCLLQSGASGRF